MKRIIDSKGFGGKLRYTIFLFLSKLFDNNRKPDVYHVWNITRNFRLTSFVAKFGILATFYHIEYKILCTNSHSAFDAFHAYYDT